MPITFKNDIGDFGFYSSVNLFNMADHYSAIQTVFVYKLMKGLRRVLDIAWKGTADTALSGAGENDIWVEGAFELGETDSDPFGLWENEQTEMLDSFDDLMIKPENILHYKLPPVVVAALMEDVEWLKVYSESRNIFDGAQGGKIYVYDNCYSYEHIMYAIWARMLWLEEKSATANELWKIIETQYKVADMDLRKEMLCFVMNTIAHIPCIDKRENAGLHFKTREPGMYEDWVEYGEKADGLPYTLVFEKEVMDYERAGENAGVECMMKSTELLIGGDKLATCTIYVQFNEYMNNTFFGKPGGAMGTEIWFEGLEPDDEFVEKLKMRNSKKNRIAFDKRRIRFFEEQLAIIGRILRPEHFFTVLNGMWKEIRSDVRELPDDISIYYTMSKEYITKEAGRYIEIIKRAIKDLKGRLTDVGRLYVKNFLDNEIEQFMFYANEFGTNGKLSLWLNDLKKIGVPDDVIKDSDIDVFDPEADIERIRRRNKNIIEIWKKCDVHVAQPGSLHKFQKQLVEECLDDTLVAAAACGIFPVAVRKALVQYAVQKKLWDKIPVLIWIERGDTSYKDREGE